MFLASLFLLPFFQGGYFHFEVFFFLAIQLAITTRWLRIRQIKVKIDRNTMKSPLVVGMVLLLCGALLSTIVAVDIGTHIFGLLRLAGHLCFLVNLCLYMDLHGKSVLRDVILSLVSGAVVMALITVVVMVIVPSDSQIADHFLQKSRIGGFFQYANTYAIYLLGCMLLLVNLRLDKRLSLLLILFLSATIVLTQSRSVLMIMAAAGLWLLLNRDYRYSLVGMVLGSGLGQVILIMQEDVLDPGRLTTLGQNQSEWLSRLLYYEDGMAMMVKRILGWGYGGYYHVQTFYQTGAAYRVRFIHNSLLQTGLDYGWLGFLGIGIILFLPFYRYMKSCLVEKTLFPRDSLVLVVLMALSVHSLIDFDFEFLAFGNLFVLSYVILRCNGWNESWFEIVQRIEKPNKAQGVALMMSIVLCLFFGLAAFSQYKGFNDLSYRLYPYYTKNVTKLLNKDESNLNLDLVAEKSVARNPYYLKGFAFLRDYHYNNGDFRQAVEYGREARDVAPLQMSVLEMYLKVSYRYLLEEHKNGRNLSESEVAQDITNTEHYLEFLESAKKNNYTIRHQVDFEMTDYMREIVERTVRLLDGD